MKTKRTQPIRISAGIGLMVALLAGLPLLVQPVQAQYVSLCRYAIFYNGLLEFSTCPIMTVNGPVHANGDIYTGSSAPITFNSTVTARGSISSPAWNGQGPIWTNTGTFNGNPPYLTNVPPITLSIGTTNLHDSLEVPPPSESPTSPEGLTRFYNQAQTVLLVTSTSVRMTIQASDDYNVPGADPSPIYVTSTNLPSALFTNFPFLTLTNSFTDQRENKTVMATDIDVGKYRTWLQTNFQVLAKFPVGSGTYPTILYVVDYRTKTGSQIPGVRLRNGSTIPANGGLGWSIATPAPLYVLGHYNCPNSAFLGTTNTTASSPAAFMSDALTILSSSWLDSKSSGSYTARAASDTTVNAAILTGLVPSTGSSSTKFSGGVQNLPRLLEDWNSPSTKVLTLNTALINLFSSEVATHQFVNPGTYYDPPTRKFSYDLNYLNPAKQPPGMPTAVGPRPFAVVYPLRVTLQADSNTNLNVGTVGIPPLAIQWSLNGMPITGATETRLLISNFGLSNAGVYSVAVTNEFGSATDEYGRPPRTAVLRLSNSPVVGVDRFDVGGGTVNCTNSALITMSSAFGSGGEIYYTLDGSAPDLTATPYNGAFTLKSTATIRAIAYNLAHTDWAEAAPIHVEVWPTYPLSVSTPGGGRLSVSPTAYSGSNLFVSGTLVTLTATPSNGWSFVGWSGDSTDTNSVTTIVMDQPRSVQANYGTSLSLFTNGNGELSLDPAIGPYPYGSTVTVTAVPVANHVFTGWSGDASGKSNPLLLTLDASKVVTGNFALASDTNLAPVAKIIAGAAGSHTLIWSAGEGVAYQVQCITNLLEGTWANLGSAIFATNSLVPFVDTAATNGQAYYRVLVSQ
jgi:uncharacterized repeat protein (TIGR02543 family)